MTKRSCLLVALAALCCAAPPAGAQTVNPCQAATVTVAPDGSRALSLCGWDSRVVITRPPEHGQLQPQLRGTGTMRYVPHPGFTGADSFAFRSADQPAAVADSELSIAVTAANAAPICRAAAASGAGVFVGPFDCYDPDEGDAIRITVVEQPAHGRATVVFGQTQYHPEPGFTGTDSFVVRADDGQASSPDLEVEVTVEPPKPPVCTDQTFTVRRNWTLMLSPPCVTNTGFPGAFMELDFLSGLDHGGLIHEMTTKRYAADDDFVGTDTLTARALGGGAASEPFTLTFDVTEKGNAPECRELPGRLQVRAGRTTEVGVYCFDADQDPLTLSVPEKPYRGALAVSSWQQFVYTADTGYTGPDRFTLQADDAFLSSGPLQQRIQILGAEQNTPPFCRSRAAAEINGGSAVVGLECRDAEGDPLTYEVSDPAHGTAVAQDTFFGAGITYTAGPDFAGEDTFTFRAVDDHGGRSAVMTGRVYRAEAAPAKPPVCPDVPAISMRPGTSRTLWIPCGDPAVPGWVDPVVQDAPDHGTLTPLGYGQYFTYEPDAGYTGPDAFVLRRANEIGHDDVTVTVDVDAAANRAPECWSERLRVTRGAVPMTVNCSDADQDPLTFAVTGQPGHGSLSGENGTYTYTPDDGYAGLDSFTISVSDGHGGTAQAVRNVRVRGEGNVRPHCQPYFTSFGAGGSVTLMPMCQDADGDPFALSVTVAPQHGTLTEPAPGQFSYTPDAGWLGLDHVTLVADDGRSASLPTVIALETRDWSQPPTPICRPMAANVAVDTARPLSLSCLLLTGFAIEIAQAPEHGQLSAVAADGTVTYTPEPGYTGPDSFAFQARNGQQVSPPAAVTLEVKTAAPLPADVVEERAIGPEPPGPGPVDDGDDDDEETPPAADTEPPAATPPAAPPIGAAPPLLTPSLRDAALQVMRMALRGVVADLGGAQAYLPLNPPRVRTRPAKLLAVACPQSCGVRVKAKLVNGRRTSRLPAQSAALRRGQAHAFSFRVRTADRRAIGNPKRGILVLDVKVRDAAGKVHREPIRVRLTLR